MEQNGNSARNLSTPETADDATKRKVWLAFYTAVGLLLVLGVAVGLGHRTDTGEALPASPVNVR